MGLIILVLLLIILSLGYWLYSNIIINDQIYITPDNIYVKVISKNFLTITVGSISDTWDVFTLEFLLTYKEINL